MIIKTKHRDLIQSSLHALNVCIGSYLYLGASIFIPGLLQMLNTLVAVYTQMELYYTWISLTREELLS